MHTVQAIRMRLSVSVVLHPVSITLSQDCNFLVEMIAGKMHAIDAVYF